MLLSLAMFEPKMISQRNLLNILRQSSYMVIFATAQMLVILIRGFDLSLGSCVSMVSVVCAISMTAFPGVEAISAPMLTMIGIIAGLSAGAVLGAFNGFCTAKLAVNPFIVTLGTMSVAFGIASIVSDGRPVFGLPDPFYNLLYEAELFGIGIPVWITGVICAGVHFLLTRTVYGRYLYLIGSNAQAAAVSGIPVQRIVWITYVIASVIVAIGALMLTGRTGSGEPNMGSNLLLPSIAAAVVGGLSLQGGIGGVGNAVMGAFFIAVLSNGMNMVQVNGYLQEIILGIVILLALLTDRFRVTTR